MCSDRDTRALPRVGSPIRKSADQRLFSTSPRLIAAVHVLHRLLTPRHPPRALRILTKSTPNMPLCSFQGASTVCANCTTTQRALVSDAHGDPIDLDPREEGTWIGRPRLSKLNSMLSAPCHRCDHEPSTHNPVGNRVVGADRSGCRRSFQGIVSLDPHEANRGSSTSRGRSC
jgi:hypothetical protein